MRGSRGSTVGGGNVVKPPLTLQLEDAKTQGFSSYSNTYPFNYLFGDKELLARQVGLIMIIGVCISISGVVSRVGSATNRATLSSCYKN